MNSGGGGLYMEESQFYDYPILSGEGTVLTSGVRTSFAYVGDTVVMKSECMSPP